jgi:hypothetical protein
MSRKTILHIEFFSLLTMSIVLGAWLPLSFQYMNGGPLILLALLTVFIVAVVVFDAYRVLQRLSPNRSQSKKGILLRLIGTIFVATVTGMTFTLGFENWMRGDAIFWAQLVSTVGLLFLAIMASRKMMTMFA